MVLGPEELETYVMAYEIDMTLGGANRPASVPAIAKAKSTTLGGERVAEATNALSSAKTAREVASQEEVEQAAKELNQLVHDLHRKLQFSVDGDSGETIIKVIDRETDQVVRQIPTEEVVTLRKRLAEVSGVIFKDSA